MELNLYSFTVRVCVCDCVTVVCLSTSVLRPVLTVSCTDLGFVLLRLQQVSGEATDDQTSPRPLVDGRCHSITKKLQECVLNETHTPLLFQKHSGKTHVSCHI